MAEASSSSSSSTAPASEPVPDDVVIRGLFASVLAAMLKEPEFQSVELNTETLEGVPYRHIYYYTLCSDYLMDKEHALTYVAKAEAAFTCVYKIMRQHILDWGNYPVLVRRVNFNHHPEKKLYEIGVQVAYCLLGREEDIEKNPTLAQSGVVTCHSELRGIGQNVKPEEVVGKMRNVEIRVIKDKEKK